MTKTRDLYAYNENYRQQLSESKQALLKSEAIVDRFLTQPDRAERMPSLSPFDSRRPIKLPNPPVFEGNNGISLDNWLIQVRNKLRGNAELFPSQDLKIIYASGRVGGNALALIATRLNIANQHAYQTVEDLFQHLIVLYADPNKEQNARRAFKTLKMEAGDSFQKFYALFLRYVADGNISTQDLKEELNEKLTWKLQEAVSTYYNNPAIDMTEFARYCTTNDQQIKARYNRKDQSAKKTESKGSSSLAPTVVPTRKTIYQPASTDKAATAKSGIIDVKCYNCNEYGHISRDCPKPRTERTKQVIASKLAPVV